MKNTRLLLAFGFAFLGSFLAARSSRAVVKIAITVDDLPASTSTDSSSDWMLISDRMIAAFKKHHIEGVYGFVNSKPIEQNANLAQVLKNWVGAGHFLGNHTFSHADITKLTVADYSKEIVSNESVLKSQLGSKNYKYFRYPYLAEGESEEKREAIRTLLFQRGYTIVPVTMDFFDFEWSAPYLRCMKKYDQEGMTWLRESYVEQAVYGMEIAQLLSQSLFSRDIKYVLLVHIGLIQSEVIDALLSSLEKRGAKFISLQDALSDEIYLIDSKVARDRTYTLLNQIRIAHGQANPKRVSELYDLFPEEKLNSICK